MMKNAIFVCLTLAMVMTASVAFGFGSYGGDVNTYIDNNCPTAARYTGDCLFCHASSGRSAPNLKKCLSQWCSIDGIF